MLFNEILVGRLNRWCQKFYAIKSGTASLTQLLPTVQTVNIVQSGKEDGYLQSWNRFAFTATAAAVAAQSSGVQLSNPTGSGTVAVIEKINVMPGATSLCQVFIQGSPLVLTGIVYGAIRLDRRTAGATGAGNPVCTASQGAPITIPAAAANPSFRMLATTTGNTEFITTPNQEWTILPGDSLVAVLELVNTQVSVAIMWRERALEPSEFT